MVTVLCLSSRPLRERCWSLTEPHAPKQTVAANEMVIKSGTYVEREQGKEKPRSDAVRKPGRILSEIRQ